MSSYKQHRRLMF
ncbi:unnamed protein product [Larinioides sclopetarius]|uniref:Uncharacterized protein n=1 Tax=Larinioides sclopetarius TaxID=280406 RepID=A0AAV1ZCV0_9ARAC